MNQIDCSPAVTFQGINNYCNPQCCDSCKRVMIKARVIVTELPELCRKDLELTCIGEHISYCFWSGSRGNQIVVQPNEENRIVATTVRQTWRMFLKDVIESNLEKFSDLLWHFVRNITGFLGRNVSVVRIPGNAVIPLSLASNELPAIEFEDDKYYEIV